MDNPEQLSCLSLCTGYGGIELGLERAGLCLRPIAYVEREAFAAANLVAKIEAGEMAAAPVWTDVKTFPYADFHGRVGIMLAGYPCQPFSAAGQRKGEADERHLWPFIARGIAACQPRLVFCENVEGHLTLGIKDVFSDLGAMGYSYTAGLFSAEEVGATHRRKRLFWLAHSGSTRTEAGIPEPQQRKEGQPEIINHGCHRGWPAGPGQPQHGWEERRTVADTPRKRPLDYQPTKKGQPTGTVAADGTKVADAAGGRCEQRQPKRQAEADIDNAHKQKTWRQTEPELGGTTDGPGPWPDATANRVDRLRLLGNGVVPQTAAKAFTTLWQRLNN